MATPGKGVSLAEINDLVIRAQNLRTQLESTRRQLNIIQDRLVAILAELDPMKDALAVDVPKEEG